MNEVLKLSDFDIIGLIKLKDVKGIEKYVTPICDDEPIAGKTEYLSRSKEYYNVKSMTELSMERENLKRYVTREKTKRTFVILENMLNCSARVYFKKFEESILKPDNQKVKQELDIAKKCMEEDTSNIIKILSNNGLINVSGLVLPTGRENSARRFIEMDNKGLLYVFAKSLNLQEPVQNKEVLTPGYGSLYIGPFLKEMYGIEYTNILKSKYIQETCGKTSITELDKLISSDRILNGNKEVILLDDNIGTGKTMEELKQTLEGNQIPVLMSGAVQYNWRNYYRVSIGEKKDIDRFNVNNFEILTPFNYAGHKLYKNAIDTLHSSGEEYIRYLNSKSYRIDEYSDIKGAVLRGIKQANRTGLVLKEGYEAPDKNFDPEKLQISMQYKDSNNRVLRPEATELIDTIIDNIERIEKYREFDKNIGQK